MRTPVLALTFLGVLAAAPAAEAVQGSSPYRVAPETRAHRVAHPQVQERMSARAAWQDFLARRGAGWQVTWDEATGAAVRVWGEGWAVDARALADNDDAWDLGLAILAEEKALLGLDPRRDRLDPLHLDRTDGVTTLSFERTHLGMPVVDARVSLRFKNGRFVVGQFDSMPGVSVDPAAADRSAAEAFDLGLAAIGWTPEQAVRRAEPTLVVLPLATDWTVDYRIAWRFHVESKAAPSRVVFYVDATDGTLLRRDEQLRFLTGFVHAEIDNRNPYGGLTTRALRFADVEGEQGDATTDGAGVVALPGDGPQTVDFEPGSEFFDIDSVGGAEVVWDGTLTEGGTVIGAPDPGLPGGGVRRARAQGDAHVFAHEARDRGIAISPNLWWAVGMRPDVRVNIDTSNGEAVRCNAWFDGEAISFVRQGSGCHNTARLADVVYHEYGHGFHGYSIVEGAGGWGDGSMGEGLADYYAATINDDPLLAVGFFTGSQDPLRRSDVDRVWPDDIQQDPHGTGLIIAGALWDLRTALTDALGYEAGVAHADRMMWHVAMRAEDIPEAYVEVLLADDDNGNLDDGTPNRCLIDVAFGAHGLGPGAGATAPAWRVDHSPARVFHAPETALAVVADVALTNPQCADGELGSVEVRWTTEPDLELAVDAFETLVMAEAAGAWEAEIPPAPSGSFLRYRIVAIDDAGAEVGRRPAGSITDPWYGIWIGDDVVHWESDFETDDGGFTHALLEGDTESEGADDWLWGPAGGQGGDPASGASGSRVWGNDISPQENWNGLYQANVVNVLRSGPIRVDSAEGRVHVQFRRWLGVEDGFFDQAEVRVNGAPIWTNQASEAHSEELPAVDHHLDLHWAFRSYDVTDLVGSAGTVEIEWELRSDAGLQLGGWNLDDVRVISAEAPPPGDDDDDDGGGDDDDGGSGRSGSSSFIAAGQGCTGCASAPPAADDPNSAAWLLLAAAAGTRRRRRR